MQKMEENLPKKQKSCSSQDIAGLMRTIYTAKDEDITCDECYDHIDQYIDMLRSGHDAETVLPQVKAHLEQCRCCEMEFQAFISILEASLNDNQ
jgi:hypothetical protein